MSELIAEALQYIEEEKSLVEIKKISQWKQQGIVENLRSAKTCFMFDREITFTDGTKRIIWV